jgi:hypothetical protein
VVFYLERWILNLNSSIQQFVNSTLRQFDNSTIRQFTNSTVRQFVNSTATPGSASSTKGSAEADR